MRYEAGNIVWVRVPALTWWPAEVVAKDDLPFEFRGKGKPPVAFTKFIAEENYEIVKDEKCIQPFECKDKLKFLEKGREIKDVSYKLQFGKALNVVQKRLGSDAVPKPEPTQKTENPQPETPKTLNTDSSKRRISTGSRGRPPSGKKVNKNEVEKESPKPKDKDSKKSPKDKPSPVVEKRGRGRPKKSATPTVVPVKTPPVRKTPIYSPAANIPAAVAQSEGLKRTIYSPNYSPNKGMGAGYECSLCDFHCSSLSLRVQHEKLHIRESPFRKGGSGGKNFFSPGGTFGSAKRNGVAGVAKTLNFKKTGGKVGRPKGRGRGKKGAKKEEPETPKISMKFDPSIFDDDEDEKAPATEGVDADDSVAMDTSVVGENVAVVDDSDSDDEIQFKDPNHKPDPDWITERMSGSPFKRFGGTPTGSPQKKRAKLDLATPEKTVNDVEATTAPSGVESVQKDLSETQQEVNEVKFSQDGEEEITATTAKSDEPTTDGEVKLAESETKDEEKVEPVVIATEASAEGEEEKEKEEDLPVEEKVEEIPVEKSEVVLEAEVDSDAIAEDSAPVAEEEEEDADSDSDDLPAAFEVKSSAGTKIQKGDLVWVKAGKFPFWPCLVTRFTWEKKRPKRVSIRFINEKAKLVMGYNKKTILPFGESYEKHAELIEAGRKSLQSQMFVEAIAKAESFVGRRCLGLIPAGVDPCCEEVFSALGLSIEGEDFSLSVEDIRHQSDNEESGAEEVAPPVATDDTATADPQVVPAGNRDAQAVLATSDAAGLIQGVVIADADAQAVAQEIIQEVVAEDGQVQEQEVIQEVIEEPVYEFEEGVVIVAAEQILSEESLRMITERNATNQVILEFLKSDTTKEYLIGILQEEIACERHQLFNGSVADRDRLKHHGFGPITDDAQQEEANKTLMEWYREATGQHYVDYVLDVWLPEALVYAIMNVYGINIDEAWEIFNAGPELTPEEQQLHHQEIIATEKNISDEDRQSYMEKMKDRLRLEGVEEAQMEQVFATGAPGVVINPPTVAAAGTAAAAQQQPPQ